MSDGSKVSGSLLGILVGDGATEPEGASDDDGAREPDGDGVP